MSNGIYYVIEEYKGEKIIIEIDISGDETVGRRAFVGTIGDVQKRLLSYTNLDDIFYAAFRRLIIARNSIDENRHDTYQPPLNLLHLCTFFHDNLIDIEIILNYRKKRARFFSRHSYLIEQKPFADALSSIMNEIEFQKNEIAEEYNDNSLKGILKRLERTKQQKIDRKKYPELCPKENTKIGFWKTIRAGIITSKYGKECGIEYLEGKGQYKK